MRIQVHGRARPMSWPPPPVVAVVVLVLVAAAWDVLTRRIPNTLTLGATLVAIAMGGVFDGWFGVLVAVGGCAVGLILFVPLYALGGMAAGDVKLLAAVGAWLGPWGAVSTALYGAIAGGVLAVVVVLARGRLAKTAQNIGTMLATWRRVGLRPVEGITLESSAGPRLPYALPLAVGTLITIWTR